MFHSWDKKNHSKQKENKTMRRKKVVIVPLTILLASVLVACGTRPNRSNQQSSIENTSNNIVSSDSSVPGTTSQQQGLVLEGISLNYEQLSMYRGKSLTLRVIFNPTNYPYQDINWSSSDSSIATVTKGTISAIAIGECDITATTPDEKFSATCHLTVREKDESETYIPDSSNSSIFFITNDTLSSATYDSSNDEYTYTISGSYEQVYVNVPDKAIVLELNGVTIQNTYNSPIYVASCDKLEISAKKNTTNNIKDNRPIFTEEEANQGKGAIFVDDGDLKLKGSGTLNINTTYYNGIHVKDDVKIQKLTLNVTAVNHGIRGNDSITVTSGTINVTCGGDGLHTENSDISNKGNQKGSVVINGGTLTINSWSDAVQAAYNVEIKQTDTSVPITMDMKTNKYSSYTGETVDTSATTLYLKMNSSTYSNGNYTYAALIDGEWVKATYKGTSSESQGGGFPGGGGPGGGPGGPGGGWGGGSSTYYYYELNKPASASSFTLYRFAGNNVTEFSETSYNAKSDAKAFNEAYDTVQISISSNKISFGSWSNYSSGNSNGADISAKGIKAENEIYIESGTISIKSYDDAIHANNDGALENGVTPLGNVKISGGELTLNASDDGIHADYTLEISGGKVNVETAYEGLEGNVINVSGGETYVYATDDGMNATKGNSSPAINVTGGLLDIAVSTNGDTDGIDSNGTFNMNGGVVIVKGPGSASSTGSPAAALDTDGAITLSKGTLIVFGGIERNPSTSLTKTLCSSKTVNAGDHVVTYADGMAYKTTLKGSANGCVTYSDHGSATLN